jgi:SAM-dependent methyltransferase
MSSGQVGDYYDRLGHWNRWARAIGFGGGGAALTVHRALADPRAGGQPTYTRLHDLLLEQSCVRTARRVLDAGCGLGGTMFAIAGATEATCLGVTLSRSQVSTVMRAASGRGLCARVSAVVQSYDDPPPGPFDLVLAVESLAHSADPVASVRALAGVLAPAGTLVIVDDMPELAALSLPELATFKRGWQCPVLLDVVAYRTLLRELGLHIVADLDLTGSVRPRPLARIQLLEWLNGMARRLVPKDSFRRVMDSHRGGLALERLNRRGVVRYRMLVASKVELQVS